MLIPDTSRTSKEGKREAKQRLHTFDVQMPAHTGRTWRSRQIHVTAERICFGQKGSEVQIDEIPLEEVVAVTRNASQTSLLARASRTISKAFSSVTSSLPSLGKQTDISAALDRRNSDTVDNLSPNSNLSPNLSFKKKEVLKQVEDINVGLELATFTIRTSKQGNNAGRSYQIKAETQEQAKEIVQKIRKIVEKAIIFKMGNSIFARARRRAKILYDSDVMQMLVAFLICGAFIVSIVSAELLPTLSPKEFAKTQALIEQVELGFTIVFTAELLLNLFANFLLPFFMSMWNVFDLVVVVLCWLAEFSSAIPNVNMLRLLRVFRIVRLFRGLKSLRRIVHALYASLVPVFNACCIFLITTCIYAVIATSLFKDRNPAQFGKFSASAFTMFQVASGDAWASEVTRMLWADEQIDIPIALFFVSFVLIVGIVLLNVVIACLLDKFITTMAEEKDGDAVAEREEVSAQSRSTMLRHMPLDALLKQFLTYVSIEDLESKVHLIWEIIDLNQDGLLTCQEMTAGLRMLDISPPIYLSTDNFLTMTEGLLDKTACLDKHSFTFMITRELHSYMERQLIRAINFHRTPEELGTLCGLKLLVSPLFRDVHHPKAWPMGTRHVNHRDPDRAEAAAFDCRHSGNDNSPGPASPKAGDCGSLWAQDIKADAGGKESEASQGTTVGETELDMRLHALESRLDARLDKMELAMLNILDVCNKFGCSSASAVVAKAPTDCNFIVSECAGEQIQLVAGTAAFSRKAARRNSGTVVAQKPSPTTRALLTRTALTNAALPVATESSMSSKVSDTSACGAAAEASFESKEAPRTSLVNTRKAPISVSVELDGQDMSPHARGRPESWTKPYRAGDRPEDDNTRPHYDITTPQPRPETVHFSLAGGSEGSHEECERITLDVQGHC